MLLDLNFETIKFIVTRFKTNPSNISFKKLNIGEHFSFSDEWWDYWIYDTYEEMTITWPNHYDNSEFPASNTYPDEENM